MARIARNVRRRIGVGSLALVCGLAACQARGEDLFLADGKAFPGQLWVSQEGRAERSIHRRAPEANPAYPHAAMKLGQVAVGPDGQVHFCSGLDGYVMTLKDGRHEIQSFEFGGQIRDVACTGEEHTVYFSVVPTPRNGEPLADGKIYRRDLWDGRPTEIATVRQSDDGGNWWGAFTIRNGVVYLATFEDRSRLFKLTSGVPQPVFAANSHRIHGIAAGADGKFYVAVGSDRVYRTSAFDSFEIVATSDRRFTDVAVRAAAGSPGP